MTLKNAAFILWLLALPSLRAQQTTPADSPGAPADAERWNLFYQATSIGQHHGPFRAPYSGPHSLQSDSENDASLTSTFFFGLSLAGAQFYLDPEIAGGRGLSGVNGIANAPNGELPRVASATPKPYIARAYVAQDFGFGAEKQRVESDQNQLAGERPMVRYTFAVGKFTVTDFFDNNRYTHDPRTQFMAWGVMYNGAWDYPADTRGYTWGMVHEFHTRNWSFRYARVAEATEANGSHFDLRLAHDHGDVFEQERRYTVSGHPGAVRVLEYLNHTDSGSYADAIRMAEQTGAAPDVTAVRRLGALKYGTGVNLEQEVHANLGAFIRLGWNDGKTQDFAFTTIDRLASGGLSLKGAAWSRVDDVAATSFTASGLSGVHALYLARGGLDFLIGDGKLNYAPEYVWESYYSARVLRFLYVTFDLQRVNNPAFNRDRGPVWIESFRLHVEQKAGSGSLR